MSKLTYGQDTPVGVYVEPDERPSSSEQPFSLTNNGTTDGAAPSPSEKVQRVAFDDWLASHLRSIGWKLDMLRPSDIDNMRFAWEAACSAVSARAAIIEECAKVCEEEYRHYSGAVAGAYANAADRIRRLSSTASKEGR